MARQTTAAGDHGGLGRQPAPRPGGPAPAGRRPGPGAVVGAGPRAGPGVRGLPHRPAPAPRVTCRGTAPRSCPATRSWARWSRAAPDVPGPGRRGPGRHRLAAAHLRAAAAGAARAPRTSAGPPAYTGWDADGGFAEYAVVPAAYVYRLPARGRPTCTPRRCCAPGSSATARCAGPQLPPGGRLGIYGFGASAHLTAQIALAQGAEVHVLTRDAEARGSPSSSGRPRRAGPTTSRRCRWTPRSCSPRPATWCRSPWPRSTGAARSRSPASTSATSPRWTTSGTCSGSGP